MSKQPVLSSRTTEDALKNWAKKQGEHRVRGVCTSFGIEGPVWERILEKTFGKIPCHIALVDFGSLQKEAAPRWAMPVRFRAHAASFHPKVMLWWAEEKTSRSNSPKIVSYFVGLGSANLTSGGVGGHNLELMLYDEGSPDSTSSPMAGVVQFLLDVLNSDVLVIPKEARKWKARIERIRNASVNPPREGWSVISSVKESLGAQIKAQTQGANLAWVMSPWHCPDWNPLGHLGWKNGQSVSIFSNEGEMPKVVPGLDRKVMLMQKGPKTAETQDASGETPDASSLHAKAYGFSDGSMFVGSANCTHQALAKSAAEGGNVEVLAFVRLDDRTRSQMQNLLERKFCEKSSEDRDPSQNKELAPCVRRILRATWVSKGSVQGILLEWVGSGCPAVFEDKNEKVRWDIEATQVKEEEGVRNFFKKQKICSKVLYERVGPDLVEIQVHDPVLDADAYELAGELSPGSVDIEMLLVQERKEKGLVKESLPPSAKRISKASKDGENVDDEFWVVPQHYGRLDRILALIKGDASKKGLSAAQVERVRAAQGTSAEDKELLTLVIELMKAKETR